MIFLLKADIENTLTNDKVLPSIIGATATILVFIIGILTKDFFEKRVFSSKLKTEHKFNQRKLIKEVLAKYKIHLLSSCEDFNRRMINFSTNHKENWLQLNGNYTDASRYYFHSFIYRHLAIFAWVKKIQKEMIYLDTTIASKVDLEFVKFLNLFPRIFCDLAFLEGTKANGNKSDDHFYRDHFNLFADTLITCDGIKSFSIYTNEISNLEVELKKIYNFFDGISPNEERKRWHRLHFFHITVVLFLNNYGYDFQITNKEKFREMLTSTKKSEHLAKYLDLLKEYHLDKNKKIKKASKVIIAQIKN